MGHKTRSRKREAAARSQHPGLFRSGSHEPARTGAASPRSNASVALASAQEWVRWLVPLLVVLCTLAAFLPTLQNHFVNWDDDINFLDNFHYRGLAWTHLRWMWTTHLGHYIPLTWMTLGMDYLLWGMNPVGYHLTSLLLHVTSAVVVFFLARRLLTLALPRASGRGHALTVSAGFAALVFAIHPLRVESVAWATERRDVLSGLFYLLTLLTYLRACERGARGQRLYWLSVALFGCALLSKSMAVSLPVVLLILEVYPLRRLGGSLGWSSAFTRGVYVEKIPFVLLAAAASAITLMAQLSTSAMVSVDNLRALDRLAVSAHRLGVYLWKAVGVLRWDQVQIWHDSERLWIYALAIDPDSPIAHSNLGELLDRQGRPAEAIDHFQQALRTKPDFPLAHNNWGMALKGQGRPAEAIDHFQQALRLKPDFAIAHNNWGTALGQQG